MTRKGFRLVALMGCCVFAAFASPAFAQTSVAGDWELTIQSPQGGRTVPVTLKQDGEKITGAFKSPNGELPIAGTLIGTELKIVFTVPVQGQALDISMTGKVEGESVAGTAQFGGFGEGEFTMKRPAPATSTAPDTATTTTTPPPATTTEPAATTTAINGVAGKWDVTIKTPGGDVPTTATIEVDGDKISGTIVGPLGEVPLTGTIEGKTLKLSMVAKTPQGDLNVTMTGDLDGDTIVNGKAALGGMGQGEWSAKRAKP